MKQYVKGLVKGLVFRALDNEKRFDKKIQSQFTKNSLYILNFHRVCEEASSAYEAIKPQQFDQLIGWLLQRFHITTFRGLNDVSSDASKPMLILSFDDGYKDFIDVVVPILQKHGVSANQNIIPLSIKTGLPPMNVVIQDFIGQAPASLLKEMDFLNNSFKVNPNKRVASGLAVSKMFKNLPIKQQKQLFSELQFNFDRFDDFEPTKMMNLEEVQQIAKEYEIGSHSFEHATMGSETNEYLVNDAKKCIEWHEENLFSTPEIYAFPNGSYCEPQLEALEKIGFKFVLAVGEQFSSKSNWLHHRFTMYGNSISELKVRACGQRFSQ